MRRFLLLLAVLPACDDHDAYFGNESEALFGIEQSVDEAGVPHLVAGYELLGLADQHHRGWGLTAFREGASSCFLERLTDRIGPAPVDRGAAVFGGGRLPAAGLTVLANQPDAKLDAEGWKTGDRLTFDVSGFALPRIDPFRMAAPRTELSVTGVTPVELAMKRTDDLTVTWTPPPADDPPSRVMVGLRTADGVEVRCFVREDEGRAVIPSAWVARLFDAADPARPLTGTLTIASHRQTTVYGQGNWIVYVVASHRHRELPFTGAR